MPVLPGTDKIGDWNVTQLTKWVTDWMRNHPLPTVEGFQTANLQAVTSALAPTLTDMTDSSDNVATTAFVWNLLNTVVPGHQISYTEITTNVNVTGTAPSAATTIITTPAITLDGTQTIVEFFAPVIITPSVSGSSFNIGLFESTSMIAQIASVITPAAANMRVPIFARYLYVPAVGSHTYTIKAWVTSTTGTPLVGAGTGTGGTFAPAYVAFLKS